MLPHTPAARASDCRRIRNSTSPKCLVGPQKIVRAQAYSFVEVPQGALQFIFGLMPVGDVLERPQNADHIPVDLTQGHLVRLDPTPRLSAAKPLENPELGSPLSSTSAIPIDEPLG